MNVIEIFSCSGGMAEGLRRAGLPVSVAIDNDPDACASYAANIGHAPLQIDVHQMLRLVNAGWAPLERIDLIVADPPCTPWSRAGKRLGTADDRDTLESTIALIKLLRPRAYLIGNVPGLDDDGNWSVVQETIGSLAAVGYCAADFARLDAADYGVPQHRLRPYWFGHLDGPCIRWPARTHGAPSECVHATLPGVDGLLPWVTCRQALEHLPLSELGRRVRLQAKSNGHPPSRADAPSLTIPASMPGNGGRVVLWPWDRPSTVVCAGETIAPPGRNGRKGESQRSHANAVKLSERAGAILQGFPDGWVFVGKSKTSRWSQIGQAVPPAVAQAIGRAMKEQLLASARRTA